MKFEPATRKSVKPLIGLTGKSGTGKTLSALFLARGIVGPSGKIGLIDTENGRGSIFVDMIPGGYEVLDLGAPFSPERYSEAVDAAEECGVQCLVLDSMSHEWNGPGGYLEQKEQALDKMAGTDWQKRDKCTFAAAARCKPAHNRLIARILRSKMAIILCFRGKEKVRMEKTGQKTEIIKDDFTSPIQDGEFIFEMLIAAETLEVDGIGGYLRVFKHTHIDLLNTLPKPGQQVTIEHGAAIAAWANNAKATRPQSQPAVKSNDETTALKDRIWKRGRMHYRGVPEFQEWLLENEILRSDETLATLPVERLREVADKVEESLEVKF